MPTQREHEERRARADAKSAAEWAAMSEDQQAAYKAEFVADMKAKAAATQARIDAGETPALGWPELKWAQLEYEQMVAAIAAYVDPSDVPTD